jgi:hypothetical protein
MEIRPLKPATATGTAAEVTATGSIQMTYETSAHAQNKQPTTHSVTNINGLKSYSGKSNMHCGYYVEHISLNFSVPN